MAANICWIETAKQIFAVNRPEHFTEFNHCSECAEHDETLRNHSIDDISLKELGNPGWDPITFSNVEGILFYFPALIRLSLESIAEECYFENLLFHLEYDGENNQLIQACSSAQRSFVSEFLSHMILTFTDELDTYQCLEDAVRVHELWAGSGGKSKQVNPT